MDRNDCQEPPLRKGSENARSACPERDKLTAQAAVSMPSGQGCRRETGGECCECNSWNAGKLAHPQTAHFTAALEEVGHVCRHASRMLSTACKQAPQLQGTHSKQACKQASHTEPHINAPATHMHMLSEPDNTQAIAVHQHHVPHKERLIGQHHIARCTRHYC